jgi:nicotinamide-nucleotide amidase
MMPPRIEIISTGDEVVNGDVLDTNGAKAAKLLSALGFHVARFSGAPDSETELTALYTEVSARADLCIACGGLGPTTDDLTTDIVSKAFNLPLEINAEAEHLMRERIQKAGLRFAESNLRSARIPQGAEVYQNQTGSAPGYAVRLGKCLFFFLPGPPREYLPMLSEHVLPRIERNFSLSTRSVIRQFKTLGWSESLLADELKDFETLYPVRMGYRAHSPEVWVKINCEGTSFENALEASHPAVTELQRRLGHSIFAEGEETLPARVHNLLLSRAQSQDPVQLAFAESCTGGALARMVTQMPGSSVYFAGGVVSYANSLKQELLEVSPDLLSLHGAVSLEVASVMGTGAARIASLESKTGNVLGVGITGVAGPTGGSDAKPVGLVYIALANASGVIQVLKRNFRGERGRIQNAACLTALEMIRRHLNGYPPLEDGVA